MYVCVCARACVYTTKRLGPPKGIAKTMDIRKWCSSSHKRSIKLGRYYNDKPNESASSVSRTPQYKLRWRAFWIKYFTREKIRKIFEAASVNTRRLVPYDPCSYSQNFDHRFAWDDHDHDHQLDGDDNLSRSFSFRFADPSTKNVLVKLEKELV